MSLAESLQGVPPFEYDRLTENLLAGRNPLFAADVAQLAKEGVTHILDLREEKEWLPPRFGQEALEALESFGIQRFHLPVTDRGAPTADNLNQAARYLAETLQIPQAQVYVHCRAGQERTAAILVAYFAVRAGVAYEGALSLLQQGRPTCCPLPCQKEAVLAWIAKRMQITRRD